MSLPTQLTVAVSQSHTLATTAQTLAALSASAAEAASRGVDLLLYPEAYLGGYPRGCNFGSSVGGREAVGREQYLRYWRDSVDLGDTPRGMGREWVERRRGGGVGEGEGDGHGKGEDVNGDDGAEGWGRDGDGEKVERGDGTREQLERVAKETGIFLVVGVVERAGGSLYCAVVYVSPQQGCVGKRRKVMPTAQERLIWAQGSPSTLRAIKTTIKGVEITLASAICWENYMPLLRFSLYSQGVNLYLAPTADARDTWLPLMQTVALESRAFVLSANQCIRKKDLPGWISDDGVNESNGSNGVHAKFTNGEDTATDANHNAKDPAPVTDSHAWNGSLSRRKSIVTRTEHNHEIAWPAKTTDPPPTQRPAIGRRKSSLVPIGPHELRLPYVNPSSSSLSSPPQDENSNIIKEENKEPLQPPAAAPTDTALNGQAEEEEGMKEEDDADADADGASFACRGGSCIVAPTGEVLAGPLWEDPNGLLVARIDFDDCIRGRLDFDAAGSYSRNDAFELRVQGLCLDQP